MVLKKWSPIIAALAQVAMLVLVWYGYEYTVKPVFEMNLLSEKVAQLESNRNALESEINRLRKLKDVGEKNISALNEKLQDAEQLVTTTNSKYKQALVRYNKAEDSLSSIRLKIRLYSKQLIRSQWELMSSLLSSKLVMIEIRNSDVPNVYEDIDKSNAAEMLKKAWPNPYRDLLDALNEIEIQNWKRPILMQSVIDDTKKYINEHKNEVTCAPMDFDHLMAQYHTEIKAADVAAQQQLPAYLGKIVKENGGPNEKVVITQQFRGQSFAILKLEQESSVEKGYSKQLTDAAQDCAEKAWTVYQQFTKAKATAAY
ncbi:MAG: hypothetical protein ACRESA_08530 [Gammaproteobacteria bacterium]